MVSYNIEKYLKAHILPLSNSDDFHSAKSEWKLVDIEIHEDWDNYACGKSTFLNSFFLSVLNGFKK